MRSFCAVVIGCISLWLLWVFLPKHAPDLQTALKQGLHNEVDSKWRAETIYVAGHTGYLVPDGVAQILDAHSKAELFPVLAVLRKTANPREAEVLDDWTTIVSSGVRGQRCDWYHTAGFWSGYQMVTETTWSYSVPSDGAAPREPLVR